MRHVTELLGFILIIAFIFCVQGDPDIWDKAHDVAIRYFDGVCKP